jgi:hypothetical protein
MSPIARQHFCVFKRAATIRGRVARLARPAILTNLAPRCRDWALQGLGWIQASDFLGGRARHLVAPSAAQERRVAGRLERVGLVVSMITCGPDLTAPEPGSGAARRHAAPPPATARRLGAPAIRVTAGIDRRDVSAKQAIALAREGLVRVSDDASAQAVTLARFLLFGRSASVRVSFGR